MKKVIVSVLFLVFMFPHVSTAQEPPSAEPRLVKTFYKGDFIEALDNVAVALKNFSTNPDDKVIIRICSNKALPMAIASASGRPFLLPPILMRYGFPTERVFFATYTKCAPSSALVIPTEFWLQPIGSKPLPTNKIIKADDVIVKELLIEGESIKAYKRSLLKLAEALNANPNTTGLLIGFYLQSPNRILKKNITEAERFLSSKEIVSSRYRKIIIPWFGVQDADTQEPRFPYLLLIELKNCNDRAMITQKR